MKFKLLFLSFLLSATLGWGQFNIAAGATNYTQEFNTLTSGAWADNTTLTGWYASTSNTSTIATYGAGTGSTTTAGLYAFGVAGTNPLSDRALGYYASNAFTGASATGKGFIGWRLKNTTGSTITSILVTWSGEQWRRDNASAQTLNLFYQNAATVTSLTAGTWTAAPSTFTSPQLSATALALDGNTPANRTANISVTISVNIPAGEEIMLRWEDLNDSGNDHSMAIDDVTVNATIGAACASTTPMGTISGTTPACGSTSLSFSGTATLPEIYYWQTSATGTSTANDAATNLTISTSGSYYVRTYNGTCWSASSVGPYAVTVNSIPGTPTTGNPSAVCQGASVSFTGTGSSNATSYTFWDSATGGTQYTTGGGYTVTGTTLTTPTALAAGTYTYYVQGESATCSGTTRKAVTVTINTVPANPAGTISALANPSCGPATLNYSAPSATLYWQTTPSGTSTSNPTTSPFTAATSGTYYVNAYNGSCFSAGSVSLAVTVNTAPAITVQPSNQLAIVGNTATFSVTTTNAVSYQWQVSTNGGGSWSNVGTNANTYTTPTTTFAMDGYLYQVIVSGSASCAPITTDAAELSVTNPPCLSENFAVNALPTGWVHNSVTFTTNYAEFASNNGDLTTVSVANPASLTFTLARTNNLTVKSMIIEVSTTSQIVGFTTVATYNHGNTVSTGTTNCTVDLSAYTSYPTVYVRFRKASATTSPWRLDNINVYCGVPCTPATISSVTPASGPVGTEVTISASSGSLAGATATFNGVAATVVSSSATQLVVTVPSGATTGSLIVTDSQPCEATTTFTVITNDNTSCQGTTVAFNDLIISEVYDSQSNNVWHMELYNPTAAAIDLAASVYKFERYGTIGDASPTRTVPLSGIVPAGGVFLADLGDTGVPCVKTWDFSSPAQGINALDEIRLTKNNVAVDVVYCPNEIGYTIKRKATAVGPTMTYNAADWDLLSAEDCTDLGLFPASVKNTASITVQPSASVDCSTTSIVISVVATEGFAGGNPLVYQWYVVAPGSATWSVLNDGGVYSGTTTANLNISSIAGLDNYQYYCQVRENTATCFVASNAVIIKGVPSTTWNGAVWSNGIPDLTKQAIINGNYNTALNGDFECCSLTINNTFTLDIKDTDYVLIQNDLTVNGILEVQNQGSLVMISDTGVVTNTGTTNVRKMSTVFDLYDYTFWSSPVASAPISVFSQWQTNYIFKLSTSNFRDDNNDSHDDNMDAWMFTPQAEIMSPGRGYAAMGKISQAFPAQQGSVYSGAVNNGVISQPIALSLDSTKANDDFNLIGNPYPSAISADDFITANPDISGTLYFWTHEGDIQVAAVNPGPMAMNFSPDDFAYYNLAGGTGTRAGLLSGNGNSNAPNGFIASGQGFQVDADAATSVTFNNSMRNKTYGNTNFYKTVSGPVEKDRLWLNLTNSEGIFSQQLIGFFPNATMGVDRGYDGYCTKSPTYAAFYSMIGDKPYKIQGRSSFDVNDRVSLGFRSAYQKTYSISIGDIQGVLRNQNVYIEDLQLNVIHDLKVSEYVFSTPAGEFNNRFVLRFTNTTLGNTDFDTVANSVIVYTNDGINVTSSLEKIKEITVYDMLGRVIGEMKNGNGNSLKIINVKPAQAALIVKVVLENGATVSKKVIY